MLVGNRHTIDKKIHELGFQEFSSYHIRYYDSIHEFTDFINKNSKGFAAAEDPDKEHVYNCYLANKNYDKEKGIYYDVWHVLLKEGDELGVIACIVNVKQDTHNYEMAKHRPFPQHYDCPRWVELNDKYIHFSNKELSLYDGAVNEK